MENAPMNIYQRINEIRKKVAYIQKDKNVEGYKAITHDMVTSEIRPHLIENGVVIVVSETSGELRDTGKKTKSGTPITAYIAKYDVSFVNIDDPKDKVTVNIGSMAEDHGDKSPGKAISYAAKYAILKVFSIETGESDESRQEQKPVCISEDQQVEINDLLSETNSDIDKFLRFVGAKSVGLITADKYKKAVSALKKKLEQ